VLIQWVLPNKKEQTTATPNNIKNTKALCWLETENQVSVYTFHLYSELEKVTENDQNMDLAPTATEMDRENAEGTLLIGENILWPNWIYIHSSKQIECFT
jgi:hypothetical protein